MSKIYGIGSYHSNSMKSLNPHSGIYEATTSRTLDRMGGSPTCNQGGIAIVEEKTSYALQGNMIGRADKNGPQGDGVNEGVCFTLNTTDRHAVCQPYCVGNGQVHQLMLSKKAGTLNCMHEQQSVLTYGLDRASFNQGNAAKFGFSVLDDQQPTWTAKGPGAVGMIGAVRRLTPIECERLQGVPDGYTDVMVGNKRISDSARYKALGNGVALPNVDFIMGGIAAAVRKERERHGRDCGENHTGDT